MELIFDADVKAVTEFMQERVAAERLVSVAKGVAALAPLLWGQFEAESVEVLRLKSSAIADRVPCTESSASE